MWYVKLQIPKFDDNTYDMHILKGIHIIDLSKYYLLSELVFPTFSLLINSLR